MLVYLIATVVAYLTILSILSTNITHGNIQKLKRQTAEIESNFKKEKILKEAIEYFCINNSETCKNKKDGQGVITLSLLDLNSEITPDFELNSSLGGNIQNSFYIIPSKSKIEFFLNISDDQSRYIYLHHYKGKEFGLSPKCDKVSNSKDENSRPPCVDTIVYHDYTINNILKDALK